MQSPLEDFIHKSLKDEQIECIQRIVCLEEDVLTVLPPGFVTYQLIPKWPGSSIQEPCSQASSVACLFPEVLYCFKLCCGEPLIGLSEFPSIGICLCLAIVHMSIVYKKNEAVEFKMLKHEVDCLLNLCLKVCKIIINFESSAASFWLRESHD